jgi:hypothetical protein
MSHAVLAAVYPFPAAAPAQCSGRPEHSKEGNEDEEDRCGKNEDHREQRCNVHEGMVQARKIPVQSDVRPAPGMARMDI